MKRISDEVHAKLKMVHGFLDQARSRRIPEEWLSGEWAYEGNTLGSRPATPATADTASSMRSGPGPAAPGAFDSTGLTGVTPGGDDERAMMNESLASSNYEALTFDEGVAGGPGTDTGSRPASSQGSRPMTADGAVSIIADTMLTAMFRKASGGEDHLTHSKFETMEIQLGRPAMDSEAWASLCTGLGRDPQIGIDRRDFAAMYQNRLSEFDLPSAGPELDRQLQKTTAELGLDFRHLF